MTMNSAVVLVGWVPRNTKEVTDETTKAVFSREFVGVVGRGGAEVVVRNSRESPALGAQYRRF